MENQVCKNCGAEILEGQDFCTKCGTPLVTKPTCSKCGAELTEDQEYCPKCGQKVGTAIKEPISSMVEQFKAGVGGKKISKKTILVVAIPVVLIVVGLLVYSLLFGSVKGKYVLVSGEGSDTCFIFEDDYYIEKRSSDNERGTYKVSINQITLTDSDGDEIIFIREGKYLLRSQRHFNEKLEEGKTVNQSLTGSIESESIIISMGLELKSDGTYTYTTEAKFKGDSDPFAWVKEIGTYERSGNKLILSPKGENYTEIFIIKDGIVYDNVYMKEK